MREGLVDEGETRRVRLRKEEEIGEYIFLF